MPSLLQQPCPPDVQIVHMVSRAAAMSNEIGETLSGWLLAVSRRDHFRIILVNQGRIKVCHLTECAVYKEDLAFDFCIIQVLWCTTVYGSATTVRFPSFRGVFMPLHSIIETIFRVGGMKDYPAQITCL